MWTPSAPSLRDRAHVARDSRACSSPGMSVTSEPPGVPLDHYRQHHVGVRLTCLNCLSRRTIPLEPLIARLKKRGVGDEHTGIKAVAGLVARPCPDCGGSRFDSSPAF